MEYMDWGTGDKRRGLSGPAAGLTGVPEDQSRRCWARRLASRRRLVVLAGGSPGGASGLGGLGAEDAGEEATSVSTPGSSVVTGVVGRKRSARGSTAGAVWRVRTCSRRASRADKDSSASGVR